MRNAIRHALALLVVTLILGCAHSGALRPGDKSETGMASWYGKEHHRKRTASGERYDMYKLTAAHRTLPFGTRVKVTNLSNGKTVVVRINDRGPSVKNRILDLSWKAARMLDMIEAGIARVRLEVLD